MGSRWSVVCDSAIDDMSEGSGVDTLHSSVLLLPREHNVKSLMHLCICIQKLLIATATNPFNAQPNQ